MDGMNEWMDGVNGRIDEWIDVMDELMEWMNDAELRLLTAI